jgi:hypothetical protein
MQVLKRAKLRVYEEGAPLNAAGKRAERVMFILRGSAALRLEIGKEELRNTHYASSGAVLFCWPVLLNVAQPFQGTASSVVLAYHMPQAVLRVRFPS